MDSTPSPRLSLPAALAGILLLQVMGSLWSVAGDARPELLTGGMLAGVLVVAFTPWAGRARRLAFVFCGLALLWFGGVALAATLQDESIYQTLALPAHATRWCLPLLLWWSVEKAGEGVGRPRLTGGVEGLERVGRWAVAATFAAHGLEALFLNPEFFALLTASSERLLDSPLPIQLQRRLLFAIGVVDLLVAGQLLFGRDRARGALAYMLVWGLVTAASRTVSFGFEGIAGTLLRTANWGIPLVLLALGTKRDTWSQGPVGSVVSGLSSAAGRGLYLTPVPHRLALARPRGAEPTQRAGR